MAIGAPTVFVTTYQSGTDAASYTTSATGAPGANELAIVLVINRKGAATADLPTLTGGGITTWTQFGTILFGTNQARITGFRALEAAPGAAAALVADFAGQTQQKCHIIAIRYTGVNTTGSNGANALRNIVTDSGTGTALLVTLAALGAGSPATAGCFFQNSGAVFTALNGYTVVGNSAVESSRASHEYHLTGSTTVAMTSDISTAWGGLAYEVVEAPAAGGSSIPLLLSNRQDI